MEPRIDLELEPDERAPRRARAALAPLESRVAPERIERLRVVVSELVTNGVVHGPGNAIRLRVWLDQGEAVRAEVDDGGERGVRLREAQVCGGGGYGLNLVATLTDEWGVDDDSSRVWFRIADGERQVPSRMI